MTQRPIDAKSGVLARTNTFASRSPSSSRIMSTPSDPSCLSLPVRRNRRIPRTPRSRPAPPSEPCPSLSVPKRRKRVHARTVPSKYLRNATAAWFWNDRRCSRFDPSFPEFESIIFPSIIDSWLVSTSSGRIFHSHFRPQTHEVRTRCHGGLGYLPETSKTSLKRKPFRWRHNPVIHQSSPSHPTPLSRNSPLRSYVLPDHLRDVYPTASRRQYSEVGSTVAPHYHERTKPPSPRRRIPTRPHC